MSKKKFGTGRHPRRFSYCYEDIASLLGTSVEAARKHAQRGNFDPTKLSSILEFVRARLSVVDHRMDEQKSLDLIERISVINKKS